MVIEVKSQTNILMCSGYRPPNTSIVDFSSGYENVLKNMTKHKHTNSVIGIDHNLDFIKHNKTYPYSVVPDTKLRLPYGTYNNKAH